MAVDTLTSEDLDFIAKCEEEFKHRFTEEDEEFMKVFNADPPKPPIVESWWVPHSGRRNDRRNNKRNHPYARAGDQERNHDRRDYRNNRGYNDYDRSHDDRGHGYRNQRNRYNNY